MQDDVLKTTLERLHLTENKSWQEIATELGTYPNKLIRAARRLGVTIRTKAEAQKMALKNGKKHPTKGRQRTEVEKLRISEAVGKK